MSELSGEKLVASALALPTGGQGCKSPVYGNKAMRAVKSFEGVIGKLGGVMRRKEG